MLTVRVATEDDISELRRVFDCARNFMMAMGNVSQWEKGYPSRVQMMTDIEGGNCFCVENGEHRVVGTFCLIFGEDSTYRIIRKGHWLNDLPYATVHRLASDGSVKGVAETCFDF